MARGIKHSGAVESQNSQISAERTIPRPQVCRPYRRQLPVAQWSIEVLSSAQASLTVIGWPEGSSAVEQWSTEVLSSALKGPFRDHGSIDRNVGSCQWRSGAVEYRGTQLSADKPVGRSMRWPRGSSAVEQWSTKVFSSALKGPCRNLRSNS